MELWSGELSDGQCTSKEVPVVLYDKCANMLEPYATRPPRFHTKSNIIFATLYVEQTCSYFRKVKFLRLSPMQRILKIIVHP